MIVHVSVTFHDINFVFEKMLIKHQHLFAKRTNKVVKVTDVVDKCFNCAGYKAFITDKLVDTLGHYFQKLIILCRVSE